MPDLLDWNNCESHRTFTFPPRTTSLDRIMVRRVAFISVSAHAGHPFSTLILSECSSTLFGRSSAVSDSSGLADTDNSLECVWRPFVSSRTAVLRSTYWAGLLRLTCISFFWRRYHVSTNASSSFCTAQFYSYMWILTKPFRVPKYWWSRAWSANFEVRHSLQAGINAAQPIFFYRRAIEKASH